MILAVVGTKKPGYGVREFVFKILHGIHSKHPDLELVSGGCRGIDTYAALYALENNIKIKVFLPGVIQNNPYFRETQSVLKRLPKDWVIEQPQYANANLFLNYKPFFERNLKIADFCTHGLGFPLDGDSSGTIFTIKHIEKHGKPTKVYWVTREENEKSTGQLWTKSSWKSQKLFPNAQPV